MAKSRPYFKPWKTPTTPELLLYMEKGDDVWTAYIAGDRVKELLASPDRRAVSEYLWTERDKYDAD